MDSEPVLDRDVWPMSILEVTNEELLRDRLAAGFNGLAAGTWRCVCCGLGVDCCSGISAMLSVSGILERGLVDGLRTPVGVGGSFLRGLLSDDVESDCGRIEVGCGAWLIVGTGSCLTELGDSDAGFIKTDPDRERLIGVLPSDTDV
jgi:hypothetical protein